MLWKSTVQNCTGIRRLVILHEDADDALQNTFINAWRNIGSFRSESSIYTWLYTIATNEAQVKLQNAILKLPEKQRIVFNLKYFEELNHKILSATSEAKPTENKIRFLHRFRSKLAVAASITGTRFIEQSLNFL